jgi:hypothetical protein
MSDRLRDWFEGQVQQRPDGYLVRPLGQFGRVYALPDDSAKDRYVARRAALESMYAAGRTLGAGVMTLVLTWLFLGGTWLFDHFSWAALSGLVALPMVAPLALHWLLRWGLLRRVRRESRPVPTERWFGAAPSEEVPFRVLPGWVVILSVVVFVVMFACLTSLWLSDTSPLGRAVSSVLAGDPRWADVFGAGLTLALVAAAGIMVAGLVREWWTTNRPPRNVPPGSPPRTR